MLRPWLDFANVGLPLVRDVPFRRSQRERQTDEALAILQTFIEGMPETDTFPAHLLRDLLKPSPESGVDAAAGAKNIADVVDNVVSFLDYCAASSSPVLPPFYRVASRHQRLISVESGFVACKAIGDPFGYFVNALEGTEADRIGRCPICDRFFFAVRKDRPACSRKCGTALRVRESRRRDDEQTLRAAELLRQGKEYQDIVAALGVPKMRARRYVNAARKINKLAAR
jgi:hypothetical protein